MFSARHYLQLLAFTFALLCTQAVFPVGVMAGQQIKVNKLLFPMKIDGNFADWSHSGVLDWQEIPVAHSEWVLGTEEKDSEQFAKHVVFMKVGRYKDRLYFAIRWLDPKQDIHYKPWRWNGKRYIKRRNNSDDMFVFRFRTGDNYSRCMLTNRPYETDIWRWSSGRSNPSGYADDMIHRYSNTPFALPAIEYEGLKGMVYFQKHMDAGTGGWRNSPRPAVKGERVLPGTLFDLLPSGSRADVAARGVWEKGSWHLEMSRALKTTDPGDIQFSDGISNEFQIGVFFSGFKLRKYVSRILILDPKID